MKTTCDLIVPWEYGIHIRPATKIAKLSKKFEATIYFKINNDSYNAKKVIELITMEAYYGEKIKIIASGKDAKKAIDELTMLFNTSNEEEDYELGAY